MNAITVVEISVSASTASERAPVVREWLLATGVIKADPSFDPSWQPEFAPGEAAAAVTLEPGEPWDPFGPTGVDIVATREVHHPIENYEPPVCPTCGVPIEADRHGELIDEWLQGTEPTVPCGNCHVATPIGDWPGKWTFQIGELAVRFNDWPPLSDAFVAELGGRLGPRWRVVYEHN